MLMTFEILSKLNMETTVSVKKDCKQKYYYMGSHLSHTKLQLKTINKILKSHHIVKLKYLMLICIV